MLLLLGFYASGSLSGMGVQAWKPINGQPGNPSTARLDAWPCPADTLLDSRKYIARNGDPLCIAGHLCLCHPDEGAGPPARRPRGRAQGAGQGGEHQHNQPNPQFTRMLHNSTAEQSNPLALPCAQVRKAIGPIATPDVIHWAPALPKTRSGKIMRRGELPAVLRCAALRSPSF